MKEKILEKTLHKSITKKIRSNINKKLSALKKENKGSWEINYQWHEKGTKLLVKSSQIYWAVIFSKAKLEVYVDIPFYLKPIFFPYKKKIIKMLEEEIKELV